MEFDDILNELTKELALDRLAEMFPELEEALEAPPCRSLRARGPASLKADRDPALQSLRRPGRVLVDCLSGRARPNPPGRRSPSGGPGLPRRGSWGGSPDPSRGGGKGPASGTGGPGSPAGQNSESLGRYFYLRKIVG